MTIKCEILKNSKRGTEDDSYFDLVFQFDKTNKEDLSTVKSMLLSFAGFHFVRLDTFNGKLYVNNVLEGTWSTL